MRYLVYDLETQNYKYCGRTASQFYDKNFVVATGWRVEGESVKHKYYTDTNDMFFELPEDVNELVGLNIKFDLLWFWGDQRLKDFFKRGGKIWDCQYAEYLIEGMHRDVQMVSMDKIITKYGGQKKLDEVKAAWENGVLTSEIDRDMLIKYLCEVGDVPNTELIYLGQRKKAEELGILPMIEQRMESLLCTTEMEYNGLKIDTAVALANAKKLATDINHLYTTKLLPAVGALPEGMVFKWSSNTHKSCLLYGGTVKYDVRVPKIDEKTGKQAVFKSGKNAGELKWTKETRYHQFKGYVIPDEKNKLATTDGYNRPCYGTGDDIIEQIAAEHPEIPFLQAYRKWQKMTKDMTTYYFSKDKSGNISGMLTNVCPKTHYIHHNLNHTLTVTGRLSSSSPNLQNIPRADKDENGEAKSRVKEMFVSRFGDEGLMMEADYSQLEVVVQGALTRDPQLMADLHNKVDFHCKRLAEKLGEPYDIVKYKAKTDSPDNPDFEAYHKMRTKAKSFSFQRAYGAGKYKIADSTGMSLKDVEELMEAEDRMYPNVSAYYDRITKEIQDSSLNPAHRKFVPMYGKTLRFGYYSTPSGTRYRFEQQEAPAFLRKKGIEFAFSPTCIKNYPVQGTGGEMVQTVLGKLYRHFLNNNNYDGKAYLVNTVHDCVWIDFHKSIADELARDVKRIMEGIPQYYKEIYNWDLGVPFPVSIEVGKNMLEKHEFEI